MKFLVICSLLFGLVASALNAEDYRTWNIITGGHFEAKLNSAGISKVTLENRAGKVIDFPIADLMPSDRKFIQAWSGELGGADGAAAEAERSDFAKKVYGDLVYSKGSRLARFTPEPTADPKYFAFYRSASWCPPCRAFTPKLVEFYENQKKENGAAFELIFISSDRNEDSMEDYMKDYDMPWPAFEFGENKKIVSSNGTGIPNLIVTDADGNKLFDSYDESGKYTGPTRVMSELEKLLAE